MSDDVSLKMALADLDKSVNELIETTKAVIELGKKMRGLYGFPRLLPRTHKRGAVGNSKAVRVRHKKIPIFFDAVA